jgi:hypothetical protein
MPKKTVLLVFIHGFKGGDDTFGRFPPHLQVRPSILALDIMNAI